MSTKKAKNGTIKIDGNVVSLKGSTITVDMIQKAAKKCAEQLGSYKWKRSGSSIDISFTLESTESVERINKAKKSKLGKQIL